MVRRVAGLLLVLSACGSVAPVDNCRVTADCPDALICVQGICAEPAPRDAGIGSPDAGEALAEDAGVTAMVDAGVVDAGVVDAGVSDSGVVDAGSRDSGVCVPSIELCNGRDDDCDGQLDEQVSFLEADGGAIAFDGGSTAPSGMCIVGLGACQRSGIASCSNGTVSCSAFVGTGSNEVCNRIDDDCDGMVDEADPGLCARAGELCVSGSCACPMGQVACGSACVTLGDACSVGQGACLRNGFKVCSGGAVACDVTAGTPSAESCNAIDDDCDGQTDESDPGICVATGQSCVNSMCECPSGQSVCNGACKALTVEMCDGQDNDCNGQTDEGLTIACLADPDDDGYAAAGAASSQQCPVGSRMARGYCPVGYVGAAQSAGADCAESDATRYRLESARSDADGDTYCAGPATNDCVGANSLGGRRAASTCAATDDCNDAQAIVYRLVSSRTDADGDNTCVGTAANDCVGTTELTGRTFASTCAATDDCNDLDAQQYRLVVVAPDADGDGRCLNAGVSECIGVSAPAGKRVANTCTATSDCNDTNSSTWQLISTRADADNDGYCSGATQLSCMGTTAPNGRRVATTCAASDDCNDASASLYRIVSLRDDADGDTWCVNAAVNTCIGANVPTGKRLASSCVSSGDDCRDSNGYANYTCSLPAQYQTSYARKDCGIGFPVTQSATVSVTQTCPTGFQYLHGVIGSTSTSMTGDTSIGSCSATSGTTVSMTCGSFAVGAFNCRIEGECVAQ